LNSNGFRRHEDKYEEIRVTKTNGDIEERNRNVHAVHEFFRLMHAKNIDGWASLWDPHGRILVPYAPVGFPDAIEGAEQIVPGFRDLFAHFGTYEYTIRALYPTLEPSVVIVEWDVEATLPAKDATYRGNNITVFKFRDSKIVEYHDYFDPRKFQLVIDAISDPRVSAP
jgi:ketosteroid isomerase-like protein